jgi:acyl-CoA thioesterase I
VLNVCEMSFMRVKSSPRSGAAGSTPRSYGKLEVLVQSRRGALAVSLGALAGLCVSSPQPLRAERPVKIVALGDSLTAGHGLPLDAAFPARLAKALAGLGFAVEIVNAGVSGDTASGGLARVDWSVPDDTDAVILELGANDMLRGIDPQVTRKALEAIVRRLTERGLPVLLCGMRAPPNYGADYVTAYEAIFPDLARKYGLLLYDFFLDGIVADQSVNQPDGLHPTAAGVDRIVERILPKAEELVAQARAKRGS